MTPDRLTVRLTPSDLADLDAIAAALRANGHGDFVTITQTVLTALTAAAHLAREGILAAVVREARGRTVRSAG